MKKYTSVASLAIKLTWLRTVLIFAAVGIIQYFVARSWLYPGGVSLAVGQSFEAIADAVMAYGLIGFAALLLALTFSGGEFKKSRFIYTLRRLGISENRVTLVFAMVFTGYFFLFWVYQLGMIFGLFAWYDSLLNPGQNALMLAAWRSDWFHTLLPLQEWSGYLRNAALCISFGGCAALGAHQMRHKRNAFMVCLPLVIAFFWLTSGTVPHAVQGLNLLLTVLFLAALVCFIFVVRGGDGSEEVL